MSFTGRTIVLHDFTVPLARRAAMRKVVGPYRREVGAPITSGRNVPETFSYYADEYGELSGHGGGMELRTEYAREFLPYSRHRPARGFYVDDACGDTMKPIVARLPGGRGFLAGWTMGKGMASMLYRERHSTVECAALAAFDLAENNAEDARDLSRAWDEAEAGAC